jgi:hypothetical protein
MKFYLPYISYNCLRYLVLQYNLSSEISGFHIVECKDDYFTKLHIAIY